MSTLQVEAIQANEQILTGADPMAIRWGINTAVREKILDAQRAGFAILPYAKFFPITRFETVEEIHSTDETQPRERRVTRSALSAQQYLEEMLAAKTAFGKPDEARTHLGLLIGFDEDMDAGKLAVMSATLLPSLSTIRAFADEVGMESPVSFKCEGEDDFVNENREDCPTCWMKWITSPLCEAMINQVATEGREVEEIFAGETSLRIVRPGANELYTARDLIRESLGYGLRALQGTWADISSELERGERKDLDKGGYQHRIRKDLHESKPQDRGLRVVEQFAKANGGGGNNELLTALAQSQVQMSQILGQIAQAVVPQQAQTTAELTPAQQRMAHARAARQTKQENQNGEESGS